MQSILNWAAAPSLEECCPQGPAILHSSSLSLAYDVLEYYEDGCFLIFGHSVFVSKTQTQCLNFFPTSYLHLFLTVKFSIEVLFFLICWGWMYLLSALVCFQSLYDCW
jgi:hypothetical protein